MPTPERKFTRIQEKGQVTLPAQFRRKLGLKKGDLVAIEETPAGMLLTPQQAVPQADLNRIADVLAHKGFSLDDLLAASRTERSQLLKEAFGLPPDTADADLQKRAKADFFATLDELQERNQGTDPEEVERAVTAAVEEVRQQRYDQRRA